MSNVFELYNFINNVLEDKAPVNPTVDGFLSDLRDHRTKVVNHIGSIISELTDRSATHDIDKEDSDLDRYAEYRNKVQQVEYGTPEYKKICDEYGDLHRKHYKTARHHPEHYSNGVSGMNLVDVTEMVCDWCAAAERNNEDIVDDINKSLNRFNMSDDLKAVIKNTVLYLNECKEDSK